MFWPPIKKDQVFVAVSTAGYCPVVSLSVFLLPQMQGEMFRHLVEKHGWKCSDFASEMSSIWCHKQSWRCTDILFDAPGFIASNMARDVSTSHHKFQFTIIINKAGKSSVQWKRVQESGLWFGALQIKLTRLHCSIFVDFLNVWLKTWTFQLNLFWIKLMNVT